MAGGTRGGRGPPLPREYPRLRGRGPRLNPKDPFLEINESEWDGHLFRAKDCVARSTGWLSYHTLRSKGSAPGFPDRTVVRERILYVETKREKGKPTPEQVVWLDRLARAGGEVYLWRPSDLDEIVVILGRRWGFLPWRDSDDPQPPHLAHFDLGALVPRSIWIPGMGRADDAGIE